MLTTQNLDVYLFQEIWHHRIFTQKVPRIYEINNQNRSTKFTFNYFIKSQIYDLNI